MIWPTVQPRQFRFSGFMSNVAIPHSRFKASILAVDDNPANLDVLAQMLAGASYEVRFATSGLMALGAVRAELPDLILLDVKMPGMDGLTVCRELKSDPTTRDVPVIFISAQDAEDDKLRAFEAGGVDYVTKPFQPAEVIARVESQLKIARLTDELRQQVLRYQLNPHFLFNSFLSIRSLIDENPEAAREMVTQLSDFTRYLLMQRGSRDIPLSEELEAIQNYLAVEKIRFEHKLQLETDLEPGMVDGLIPPFLFQPLVENALKYGAKTSQLPLRVQVTARADAKGFRFRVSNTGKWIDPEANLDGRSLREGLGVGLQNVRQRLSRRFPGHHEFLISEKDGWVHVEIVIVF